MSSHAPVEAEGAPVALAPALAVTGAKAYWLEEGGAVEMLNHETAAERARGRSPLVCHLPTVGARLGVERFAARDVLELFAFVRPAAFCLPTAVGLAEALALDRPEGPEAEVRLLAAAAAALMDELDRLDDKAARQAATVAATMARANWSWAGAVLRAVGAPPERVGPYGGLDVWTRLREWSETAPPPPPESTTVTAAEAKERLFQLRGEAAEDRPEQIAFAEASADAFQPRERIDEPRVVLAEAGTGVGKTLGYIAPASVYAAKSGGTVWISTYTKNLQRQIDQELDRLYPDPAEKSRKAVVRKGRENYLCLLNLEEASSGGAARAGDIVALSLMARWAAATRDGDMMGGDFPAWLVTLFGQARTVGLADRRGECIYASCPHYRKCFIEKSRRKAERAEIVIANHALVMLRAAWNADHVELPVRYVFDEGHHLFDAADGAFSACLSGAETGELRRWIRGADGRRRRRARGIENRIGDLIAASDEARRALAELMAASRVLADDGWLGRIAEGGGRGPTEAFLALVRQQVLARAGDVDNPYGIETEPRPPVDGLIEAAAALERALEGLERPVRALQRALLALLEDEADELDTASRVRLEAAAAGLERRARLPIAAWRQMLNDLGADGAASFVDWFAIDRRGGQDVDVGYHRHWIDPTLPFAEAVLKPAHGALITSATLRDFASRETEDWAAAEVRTGVTHLVNPVRRASLPSPFDYAARTRILVVTDIRRDNPAQVAAAYRALFLAAGGGGLGLFTAIWRLKAVHKRIVDPLEAAGIPLYAQHVDRIDTPTLVDIFRAEENSCLLGTDAVRDGVDVPGAALRLIVFDRVPWPRPDILHRARRERFGGRDYDDMLTRLRLKQAFGRLLRRAEDRGVFVMLDAMLPSRLLGAFPPEVDVHRIGLAEAVARTRSFLTGGAETG